MPFDWDVGDGKDHALADVLVRLEGQLDSLAVRHARVRLQHRGIDARRAVGSTLTLPSAAIEPERNVSEETCPSPTARRLRMKRFAPAGASRLVGMRDDARIEQRRRFERILVQEIGADEPALLLGERRVGANASSISSARASKISSRLRWRPWKFSSTSASWLATVAASSASTRSTMWLARVLSVGLRSRGSVAGLNGPHDDPRRIGAQVERLPVQEGRL